MGRILLVRHGQASWGAENYDVLSELGRRQAGLLGASLAALSPELAPDVIVHGDLHRQRDTARLCAEAAGWRVAPRVDDRWDERRADTLAALPRNFAGDQPTEAEFRQWFADANDRWLSGDHDEEYAESFGDFRDRAIAALEEVRGADRAVVFTSGGVISALVAHLLDAGGSTFARLLPVTINTGVSTVVAGRRGLTLVGFNAHPHLGPDTLTYR